MPSNATSGQYFLCFPGWMTKRVTLYSQRCMLLFIYFCFEEFLTSMDLIKTWSLAWISSLLSTYFFTSYFLNTRKTNSNPSFHGPSFLELALPGYWIWLPSFEADLLFTKFVQQHPCRNGEVKRTDSSMHWQGYCHITCGSVFFGKSLLLIAQ